jgi:hypothetical protein
MMPTAARKKIKQEKRIKKAKELNNETGRTVIVT